MGSISHDIHGKESPPDRALAELAAAQWGVVALRQLHELGFGRGAIEHRLAIGRLHPVHRGVYAVGHTRLHYMGRWMAAVLAHGPDAVLSHYTAAFAHDLLKIRGTRIHVTAPRSRHKHKGITLYRCRTLPDHERVHVGALPVTSIDRALLDLATQSRRDAERAFEQAIRLRVLDVAKLESSRRPGSATMREIIAAHLPVHVDVRLEFERRLIDLCRTSRLPLPASNVSVEGLEVDAYWPRHGVVLECDGYETHGGLRAFERDHRNTATLQLAGYSVVRITWRMLTEQPETVVALVQAELARRAPAAARG